MSRKIKAIVIALKENPDLVNQKKMIVFLAAFMLAFIFSALQRIVN